MPKPFGTMRMTTKSELLYGVLFLLLALITRSVALAMPGNFARDTVSIFSVIMLIGGVIVIVSNLPGWFPDPDDASLLRYWNGTKWDGDTATRENAVIRP